jgi:hypothetical protein
MSSGEKRFVELIQEELVVGIQTPSISEDK